MVHERDEKYEGQEDGEYHFSDDQANYEMEPDDAAHHSTEEKVAAAPKSAQGGGIEQYKRPLIGVAFFVILIFVVYKITAPTSTAAPGDFTQNSSAAAPAAVQKPAVPAKVPDAITTTQSAFRPLARPVGMSGASSSGVVAPQAVVAPPQPTAPAEPVTQPFVTQAAPLDQPISVVVQQPVPAPPVIVQQSSMYNPAHPSADSNGNAMVAEPAEIAILNQKIATLTQQSARIQVDYSQKIADYEAQNTALQGKLQDLNMRLASLETTLAHLGRAIQQDTRAPGLNPNRPATASVPGVPAQAMMQSSEPKAAYTVSAIIPGRAWLKSEGGETVTVAEGDTLKGYGRIMKIDPYDGVVELDVGGRIVALSYGATSE
jgi:hypothetical protein